MEQTIRQYKILREIGKGGMGIVYKALEPKSQRAVAIKILPPHLVNRSTVERFNREAQAMARLKHPNMIEVFDYGMEGGKHFLVMEYVEGERLKTLIQRKGPLPVKECLNIIAQAASALADMHQAGIIHRDIKPGNIMVKNTGEVKVMDFGLARISDLTNLTVEGSVVGTAEYMSPEQIAGEDIDARSDIYSLGVTLFEMLIGRVPFKAESLQAVVMKQREACPLSLREIRADIPPEVERITLKAMAKNITQRYQRAGEMLNDLNLLNGPISPRPPAVPLVKETALEAPRLKKTGRAVFVFAGILVVSGGLYIFREDIRAVLLPFANRVFNPRPGNKDLLEQTEKDLQVLEQAENHYSRGLTYSREGQDDLAISEYQKAIQLRPDYALYYKELALAWEKKKDIKKAISAWKDLLKYDRSAEYEELAQSHLKELALP